MSRVCPMTNQEKRLTDEQRDLVNAHIGIAFNVGRRESHGYDEDDMVQEAAIGMIDAARTYGREHRTKFLAHAVIRARGAVKDAKRNSGLIRIKNRSPTSRDLFAKKVGAFKDNWFALGDKDSVSEEVASREWHERFYYAFSCLGERDQVIIKGLLEGKGMREVGKSFGLCEASISLIRKKVGLRIAKIMGKSFINELERASA